MTHDNIMYLLANTNLQPSVIQAISTVVKERDAAQKTLRTISEGIDPYGSQLENWIAGQIDTAFTIKPLL